MMWIDVKERLPQDREWIVYTNNIWFDASRYYSANNGYVRDDSTIKWPDVTHWMPLDFPKNRNIELYDER